MTVMTQLEYIGMFLIGGGIALLMAGIFLLGIVNMIRLWW